LNSVLDLKGTVILQQKLRMSLDCSDLQISAYIYGQLASTDTHYLKTIPRTFSWIIV